MLLSAFSLQGQEFLGISWLFCIELSLVRLGSPANFLLMSIFIRKTSLPCSLVPSLMTPGCTRCQLWRLLLCALLRLPVPVSWRPEVNVWPSINWLCVHQQEPTPWAHNIHFSICFLTLLKSLGIGAKKSKNTVMTKYLGVFAGSSAWSQERTWGSEALWKGTWSATEPHQALCACQGS